MGWGGGGCSKDEHGCIHAKECKMKTKQKQKNRMFSDTEGETARMPLPDPFIKRYRCRTYDTDFRGILEFISSSIYRNLFPDVV